MLSPLSSQDGNFVPFTCPMDHVLSPSAWEREKLSYRDAAFLDKPRFTAPGALQDLTLVERELYKGGRPGEQLRVTIF